MSTASATTIRRLKAQAKTLIRDADGVHAHTRASLGNAMSSGEANMRNTADALLRKAARLEAVAL